MTEATKLLREYREKYGPDDPRTKAAFAARAAEYEQTQTPRFGVWFLSFATKDAFLGGVFIHAHSITTAVQGAHDKRINPGGEVCAFPPNECTAKIPEKYLNRLLSRKELDDMDEEVIQ